MRSFGDTVYVYDFGVNMSGVCTLSINGKKGTKVSMQHGELLKDNGRLEMRNLDIYYKPYLASLFKQTLIYWTENKVHSLQILHIMDFNM